MFITIHSISNKLADRWLIELEFDDQRADMEIGLDNDLSCHTRYKTIRALQHTPEEREIVRLARSVRDGKSLSFPLRFIGPSADQLKLREEKSREAASPPPVWLESVRREGENRYSLELRTQGLVGVYEIEFLENGIIDMQRFPETGDFHLYSGQALKLAMRIHAGENIALPCKLNLPF
jgi:hypothetical protein